MSQITPYEFAATIRQIAGPNHASDLALIVARMIAVAELGMSEEDGISAFNDESRELTQTGWLALVEAAASRCKHSLKGNINPLNEPVERPLGEPGALEHLRRLVVACVFQGRRRSEAPSWLVQSTLELVRPHGQFPATIDPNVQSLIAKVAAGEGHSPRIFCAYDSAAGVAFELAEQGARVQLDVPQQELAALCGCLAIGTGLPVEVRFGDPLTLARQDGRNAEQFDASVVFPPFGPGHAPQEQDALGTGLPIPTTSEAAGLVLALSRGGTIALCLLSPSFLFRATKSEQRFKEWAIHDYGLDTVVGLPRGIIAGTTIAPGLLIFKPNDPSVSHGRKPSSVFIIDARGGGGSRHKIDVNRLNSLILNHKDTNISLAVPIEELSDSDYNLSVERYVLEPDVRRLRALTETTPTVSLEDIAELYRPQAIPGLKGDVPASISLGEVGVADIDEVGIVRIPGKQIGIPPDSVRQSRKARLEEGDILLVIKGSVGKMGFVREILDGDTWLASQSFVVMRLRPHGPIKNSLFLFRFLSSSLGQANLQSLRVGSYVPGLQMADVRRLEIVLPDLARQQEIVLEMEGVFALQDQIRQLREEIATRQATIWPETPQGRTKGISSTKPKTARRQA